MRTSLDFGPVGVQQSSLLLQTGADDQEMTGHYSEDSIWVTEMNMAKKVDRWADECSDKENHIIEEP